MGFGREQLDVNHAAINYVGRFYPGTIPIPIPTPKEACSRQIANQAVHRTRLRRVGDLIVRQKQ